MKYAFSVYQTQVENHIFWVAKSNCLNGCVGQGETIEEAVHELESNEIEWLEAAKKYCIAIPKNSIIKDQEYSGKFTVRVSKSVHKMAVEMAKEQGVSLNQYVNDAIVTANTNAYSTLSIEKAISELYKKLTDKIENIPVTQTVFFTDGQAFKNFNPRWRYEYVNN